MKRASILFLKLVIVLTAIAVLFVMIRFPQTEGRAKDLDLMSIYKDPFIIYGYIASIPFYVGLYQVFKLLGFIEKKQIFSKSSVNALQNIRKCALLIIGFIIGGVVFIALTVKDDDPAGFIALSIFISVASAAAAFASSLLEKYLNRRINK